jgi:predicted patatin/cPLA2 family phospholipase
MKALICEGGGFKTALTTGILDAWLCASYDPFDLYIGVSGGAVMLSSYISKQYKRGWDLISRLQHDVSLTSFSRFVKGGYYLELDLIEHIWDRITPFDYDRATEITKHKRVEFSCTELSSGAPVYIQPKKEIDWKHYLRATSTLPVVSKCPQVINNIGLVDGAFAAPVPVQRAIALGATEIVLLRTNKNSMAGSRWNRLMSNYLLKNNYPAINHLMQTEDAIYKEIVGIIESPPQTVQCQVLFAEDLKSTILSSKKKYLEDDYKTGLEIGLDYLNNQPF